MPQPRTVPEQQTVAPVLLVARLLERVPVLLERVPVLLVPVLGLELVPVLGLELVLVVLPITAVE